MPFTNVVEDEFSEVRGSKLPHPSRGLGDRGGEMSQIVPPHRPSFIYDSLVSSTMCTADDRLAVDRRSRVVGGTRG
jgi:hypothetical protein